MGISCHIEIEDTLFKPRRPYVFAARPRIGEVVCLEWDGERYPKFVVTEVKHVPDDVEDLPAFTVLSVKRLK